jgi:hypothetical protein
MTVSVEMGLKELAKGRPEAGERVVGIIGTLANTTADSARRHDLPEDSKK